MPIEINELEINTQILPEEDLKKEMDEESKEAIIEECIYRVFQILKDKEEP